MSPLDQNNHHHHYTKMTESSVSIMNVVHRHSFPSTSLTSEVLSSRDVIPLITTSVSSGAPLDSRSTKKHGEPDLDERICKHCNQIGTLFEDWKNGDRVCTACGVVDEEHLIDDTPEWREYENDDKPAAGNLARSGLVATDESKYWGGLQPTTISKYIYNGPNNRSSSVGVTNLGKRLRMASNRVNQRIEKIQKVQLSNAKVSYQISKRRKLSPEQDDNIIDDDRPEFESLIIQDEEDANRIQVALYADKWSLQRALKLYGQGEHSLSNEESNEDLDELQGRLDQPLLKASQDLYTAYCMLNSAAQKLKLSATVTNEAVFVLCRYAQRRDGFTVRGVVSVSSSTSFSKNDSNDSSNATRSRPSRMTFNKDTRAKKQLLQQVQARQQTRRRSTCTLNSNINRVDFASEEKEAAATRREYNKWKQMGALCSALLFFASRNLKYPRSLIEVCNSIEPPVKHNNNSQDSHGNVSSFIQRKHCSRAMNELKECFPDFARSSSSVDGVTSPVSTTSQQQHNSSLRTDNINLNSKTNTHDLESVSNFIEHSLRKLSLPPVAEAAIQCLVLFWRKQQLLELTDTNDTRSNESSTKLPTVCAAIAYFVCLTGSTMQSLASQAAATEATEKKRKELSGRSSVASWSKSITKPVGQIVSNCIKDKSSTQSFDIFNQDPSKVKTEQRAYEMRRMWDAWAEQMPWERSVSAIEKSCGVSQKIIRDFYKQHLHRCRQKLLNVLSGSVQADNMLAITEEKTTLRHNPEQIILGRTPLASVLLPHVTVAISLLKADPK